MNLHNLKQSHTSGIKGWIKQSQNPKFQVDGQQNILPLISFFHLFQTETADMAPETRSSIKNLVQTYMSNPNAIILCIQGNME